MINEIEVDLVDGVILAALLQDGRPVDLLAEPVEAPGLTGGVFLGRIARADKRAGMAFVEIGTDRQAALPLPADPQTCREGDQILVQATGEPRDGKGPPVTADIALPGRFLLRTPRRPGLSLSKRLGRDVRQRLEQSLTARVGEGWTVRTAAADAPEALVQAEAEWLDAIWQVIVGRTTPQPGLIHPAPGVVARTVLDNSQAVVVRVGDSHLHRSLQGWLRGCAPDLLPRLAHEPAAIADEIPALLAPEVGLPSGGSLVIEPTRALVAVDVNAGSGRDARTANLEAAAELPRQLRLRNLGGLVVVDFIPAARQGRVRALRRLAEGLAADPAQVRLAEAFTNLGLAELARQRRGLSLAEAFAAARRRA